MKRIREWIALLAAAVTFSQPLAAATEPGAEQDRYETSDTVLEESFDYLVQADGRFVLEHFKRTKARHAKGAEAIAQQHFEFSESLESLQVVEAYTLTPDGRKLPVTDKRTSSSPVAQAGQGYQDHKITTLHFPAAEAGAEFVYRVRREQLKPLFPKQFFASHVFAREYDFRNVRVRVRAPRELALFAEARDLQGGEIAADEQGRRQWLWTYSGGVPEAPEVGAIGSSNYSARLDISSFASYPAVAQAYLERASSKTQLTAALRERAERITAGITEPRKQAEAIYRWVTENVRYLALYMSFGGVVPHEADEVLRNSYGDCKDMTVLIQALLAAKGIASEGVLVNATPFEHFLPKVAVPVGPGLFNHILVYVPSLNLYLDGTQRFQPFGVLPLNLVGKPALHTGLPGQAPQLRSLPLASETEHADRNHQTLSLDKKGSFRGEAVHSGAGSLEAAMRAVGDSLPDGKAQELGAYMLQSSGQQGTAALYKGVPRDWSKPYTMRGTFTLPNVVVMPTPTNFALPKGLQTMFGFSSMFSLFVPEQRTKPMAWNKGIREETVQLTLPEGVQLQQLPKDLTLESPFARYESRWSQDKQQISVTRRLIQLSEQTSLSPADYLVLRQMMEGVVTELRTQLRLQ